MSYYYANDWIVNTNEFSGISQAVDSAQKWNCVFMSAPFRTSEGYIGQQLLLSALAFDDAKHFMDESVKLLNGANWRPVSETYFQEKSSDEGYERPSLNKLKYAATLNSNLVKLFDIWAGFAKHNDELRDLLKKSNP